MVEYKVSVIVPVHDSEPFLEECVTSICHQTLQNIEILLIENASTDHSLDLCHELASRDSRIKVFHLDTGDLSTARNYGVMVASAPYVGFIDSDDVIAPEMYQSMYEMAAGNDLDTVVCNYVRYKKPDDIRYQYCEDGHREIMTPKASVSLNFREKISQSACTMLVSKQIASEIPFPPFRYFEDRFSTFKFLAASRQCGYIAVSYYHYLQFRGSIRNSRTFRRNHDFASADAERLKFISGSGMFSATEQPEVAAKSAESLLRKLNRMRKAIHTEEERQQYAEVKKYISYIPEHTALSLKARVIRYFVKRSLQA